LKNDEGTDVSMGGTYFPAEHAHLQEGPEQWYFARIPFFETLVQYQPARLVI